MTYAERQMMLYELRAITRTNVLKTDAEADADRQRRDEICHKFGCQFPEEVFERYV